MLSGKKLSFLSLVFAVTTVIFIGCQNPASSSDDGNKLPGTWSSTAEFYNSYAAPFDNISTLTHKGGGVFEYKLTNAGSATDSDKPSAGSVTFVLMTVSKEADFTGFKATTKSSASEWFGFVFNYNLAGTVKSYYYILFKDGAYKVAQRINGETTVLKDWEVNNQVKESTKENSITIYTDKDEKIHILVNNSDIYQIATPVLKQGAFGPI